MLIFDGETRCCNGTFANVFLQPNKEHLMKRQIFSDV